MRTGEECRAIDAAATLVTVLTDIVRALEFTLTLAKTPEERGRLRTRLTLKKDELLAARERYEELVDGRVGGAR